MPQRRVLSASRRTDLPAFHLPWFHEGLEKGWFSVKNPVSGKSFQVPATPREVAAFVFWSKNYGPFLRNQTGERILSMGMGLYFQFTLNTPCLLEPRLPGLEERLGQMAELARRFGPENIAWRFDPIVHWQEEGETTVRNNLGAFTAIAAAAARAGLSTCTTSFLDAYPKVRRRAASRGITFLNPPQERRLEILRRMARRLKEQGLRLLLCCEPEMAEALFPEAAPAACVPGKILRERFGPLSLARDKGQRAACGCTRSTDIGSYRTLPCGHDCLYCYAR